MNKMLSTVIAMLWFGQSCAVGEWIEVLVFERDSVKVANLIMKEIQSKGVTKEFGWESKYPFLDLVYSKYKGKPDKKKIISYLADEVLQYTKSEYNGLTSDFVIYSLQEKVSVFYDHFHEFCFYKYGEAYKI